MPEFTESMGQTRRRAVRIFEAPRKQAVGWRSALGVAIVTLLVATGVVGYRTSLAHPRPSTHNRR
jgi:hypothetical protein